jgi:hypothetical protein
LTLLAVAERRVSAARLGLIHQKSNSGIEIADTAGTTDAPSMRPADRRESDG